MAKLSYCMYLWHPIVIRFFYFSTTQLMHWSVLHICEHYFAVLLVSAVLGGVTHVCLELPLIALERLFL